MFDRIFEAMYAKVFINIIVKRFTTLVYIEIDSKKGVQSSLEKEFESVEFNDAMYEFIQEYVKESPYFYVTVLDTSSQQGAVPTCSKNRIDYYALVENIEYKCQNKTWAFYTTHDAIVSIKKKYATVGVDYIFSPYAILSDFFKDKIDSHLALYILVQENYLSIAIYENSQLLYAHHLDMMVQDDFDAIEMDEHLDELPLDDDAVELDNITLLDEEEIEDFADIEDLDAIDDIDEFSENKDVDEELLESTDTLKDADDTKFNEDYQRFTLIQSAVAEFYKDERYESRFVENVYVADSVGVTNDFKKYLEEEMFFNVYVRRADLALEVCELAKKELGL